MKKKTEKINFEAYFLGPKAENFDFYARLLNEALQHHCNWRKTFGHLDKEPFVSEDDKRRKDFKDSQERIEVTLLKLHELLKANQPFFSPRYIGHMNWEVMAAPIIASFSAALYNPNNVARAGSTGTSDLELEVANDFIELFGYEKDKAWGHICTGGTIANMEALWIARNMKVMPLALQKMLKHFKINKFEISLLEKKLDFLTLADFFLFSAFNPMEILDLKSRVFDIIAKEKAGVINDANELDTLFYGFCAQATGLINMNEFETDKDPKAAFDPGLVFMPATKHYSLKKSMDLLGMGTQNIRYVPVNRQFRMDTDALEEMILAESKHRPVLAVIGILGSTEISAVDEVHKIVALRERLNKRHIGFHIHVDAAYGGYLRSLFLDDDGEFLNKSRLDNYLKELGIIGDKPERSYASWPAPEVFDAFEAVKHADTITVDPHKLGYVLYPAGGIAMKDKRMREAIQVFAPYVFPKPKPGEPDVLIGSYILEGSKPGSTAAAVWTAHRILPLNITGYGKLIGETIDGAQALYYGLSLAEPCQISSDVAIEFVPLSKPDLNIVNYFFNFSGNSGLGKMNQLTGFVINAILGYEPEQGKSMISKEFIVSDTELTEEEYGDSPMLFLSEMGVSMSQWKRIGSLKVARSVIMSPYLTPDYVDENYVLLFIEFLKRELKANAKSLLDIFNEKSK